MAKLYPILLSLITTCCLPDYTFSDGIEPAVCGWQSHSFDDEWQQVAADECLRVSVDVPGVKLMDGQLADLCDAPALYACVVTDEPASITVYTRTFNGPDNVSFRQSRVKRLPDGTCPPCPVF